jgi:hypothetical protein
LEEEIDEDLKIEVVIANSFNLIIAGAGGQQLYLCQHKDRGHRKQHANRGG